MANIIKFTIILCHLHDKYTVYLPYVRLDTIYTVTIFVLFISKHLVQLLKDLEGRVHTDKVVYPIQERR
mgnify:FL=1